MSKGPRVLFLDIETAPILAYVWGIYDQNIPTIQIKKDWHLLSWSAKWLGDKKAMHMNQANVKNIEDDKKIMKGMWKLLDEADVVIYHNGDKFDKKKINTRFLKHRLGKPSSYKTIDTLKVARQNFAITSNKMEYIAEFLGVANKKYKHKKFPGFELWKACLTKNKEAWKEMEQYNSQDVYTLEDIYNELKQWVTNINFNVYYDEAINICTLCGNDKFTKNGHDYTKTGKFQRFKCTKCPHEEKSRKNLFSKEKMESLRVNTK